MSIYITSQCLGWSDGCYSNPELDQLYDQQRQTFDREERQALVHEFQQIHYEDIPEIALVYPELLHAHSTDWEGWVNSPTDGGAPIFAWRVDSYMNLRPATAGGTGGGTASDEGGGIPAGVWIALAVIAVALVVGAVVMRGRREEDEA
jgi:hypothetical protein